MFCCSLVVCCVGWVVIMIWFCGFCYVGVYCCFDGVFGLGMVYYARGDYCVAIDYVYLIVMIWLLRLFVGVWLFVFWRLFLRVLGYLVYFFVILVVSCVARWLVCC